MAQTHTRYGFPETVRNNIEATWGTVLKDTPTVYPMVFKVSKMDESQFEFQNIPGLTLPSNKEELGQGVVDSTRENYKVVIRPVFDAKVLEFSEEWQQDDRYGVVQDIIMEAGEMMIQGKEAAACDVFNNATTALANSKFRTGGDKQALLSTAHPTAEGGGNLANTGSTYLAPSQDAIEAVLNRMRAQKNDRGIPKPLMPKKIISGTSNCLKFKRILGSSMVSDTTDNAKNVIPGEGLGAGNIVELYYLTNQRFWAIQTNFSEDKGLVFFDRMDDRLIDDYDVKSWKQVYSFGNRYGVAYIDWRCIDGYA